jgi:hypothetical protein
MEKHTIYIGIIYNGNHGDRDERQPVNFQGELIGRASRNEDGDTRGSRWELYQLSDERLILHTENFSRWQGEHSEFWVEEILWEDLQPEGDRAPLGAKLDLWERSLTIDEALALQGTALPESDKNRAATENEFRFYKDTNNGEWALDLPEHADIGLKELLSKAAAQVGLDWLKILNQVHERQSNIHAWLAEKASEGSDEKADLAKKAQFFLGLFEEMQDFTEYWGLRNEGNDAE